MCAIETECKPDLREPSGAGKVVAAGLVTVGGGIGGTVLYAKWDHKFRAAVETNVPYSDRLLGLALGPASQYGGPLQKQTESVQHGYKAETEKKSSESPAAEGGAVPAQPAPSIEEASIEATHIISAISEVSSIPAPCDSEVAAFKEECTECHAHEDTAVSAMEEPETEPGASEALKERPVEEVTARLAQQDQRNRKSSHAIGAQEAALQAIAQHTLRLKEAMEAEVPPEEKSAQWKDLEASLAERTSAVTAGETALSNANEALHMSLVNEAKLQFQREVTSLTPEIQANWKGLTGKLSEDDLNSLIAHAHRRIDQLNRELAEQRVREQIHIDASLEQQRLEDQKALEKAVSTALQHVKEEARLEQERKLSEMREVMEAEMRTQLRRQAAAHTDHVQDVLKVQETELRADAEQVLIRKLLEQETSYRQLSQEQLDDFTLDMNTAYARLKGVEEAIDSHVLAEEEARKAHHLWLSVEALNFTLKTAEADVPTQPLEGAAQAVRDSCRENDFALALASALPEESLQRGVYSEASLRARFNALRSLARRVALVDETHNSLYQYFLSYLQAALLFEDKQEAPPAQLSSDNLDPFKILSYASFCLEHGDLELAAKLVNQLRGEARRVVEDWLTEARLTLETRQVVSLLSAYANAVGLGTTQAP
ncbi:hypothetical protein KUCAC02_016544 [Chaenocephalus aceratus]|nr:hypothetical protein KUCAC02_016544 [Chaenocephalus aceratus]